ncbi:MAG: serine/threonine protein kinase [Myxococcales bacterium]|nr:serine/threonine protein kinase [Myxococcales bacterium]
MMDAVEFDQVGSWKARPHGAALFVLVEGAAGRVGPLDAAIQTVCDLGEVLRTGEPPWRVGRVVAGASSSEPVVMAVQRELCALAVKPVDVALLVLVGPIGGPDDDPRLEGATGPASLRDIAAAARTWRAERYVIAVAGWSAAGGREPELRDACARALESAGGPTVVAVGLDALAQPTLEGLLGALEGSAIDPSTGTVTYASLLCDVARAAPGALIEGSSLGATLFSPGPLAGASDPRRSHRQGSARRAGPLPAVPAADDAEDLTGAMLPGQFRIDGLFARGGFGAIYRARQLAVERDVAIKVLRATVEHGAPSGRLFLHEIQSVGRIDHPNVVRIHHADVTATGRLFFVMELLEGRDLEKLLADEGLLPRARAVALIGQLLAGLGAAHEVGLVHADVKPANALVVPRGGGERLVLVDFGLARLRPVDQPARSVGGTPAYMAPEQLREGRVDARSDLFSATLVLVTLLTGWRRSSLEEARSADRGG